MVIFASGTAGVLIRLVCPHCGEVQSRARKPPKERYACRKCRKRFTREQGEPKPNARW
jgi:transposase-like protein